MKECTFVTSGKTRDDLRLEREDRLETFIRQKRPVRAVAALEGIDHHYALRLLRQVARDRGLEFQPRRVPNPGKEPILGLTEASKILRSRLGDTLYSLDLSRAEAALKIGIGAKAYDRARDTPFNHDWSLSQIERLAQEADVPLKMLFLRILLTREELKKLHIEA